MNRRYAWGQFVEARDRGNRRDALKWFRKAVLGF